MNPYLFSVEYKLSYFNKLVDRLFVGVPLFMGGLFPLYLYFGLYGKTDIFSMYVIMSVIACVIAVIFTLYGTVLKPDPNNRYTFYITNTHVFSQHPDESEQHLNYTIKISDIKELSRHTEVVKHLPKSKYQIKTTTGKFYELPTDYFSPENAFKVLRKLRPELS